MTRRWIVGIIMAAVVAGITLERPLRQRPLGLGLAYFLIGALAGK